jgi:uncharacterized protein
VRSARPALLAIVCLALLAPPAAAQDPDDLLDLDQPTTVITQPGLTPGIKTIGEASVTARNDTARVTFGMAARRRTGPAALAVSARKARRVIARLRAGGVEAADIRTLAVRLTRYRRKGRVLYAVARNTIRVTIRDVDRVGSLIDAAVAAGATDVSGPSFFIGDPKELYRQALLAAFDDAEAKAEALARRAGVSLGTPITITEGVDFDTSFGGGGQDEAERRVRTPTRPGRSSVTAAVTVVFGLDEL